MRHWWKWGILVVLLVFAALYIPGVRSLFRGPADMVDAVSMGLEIKRLEAMVAGFKKEFERWPTEDEFQELLIKNFATDRGDNLRSAGLVDMWGEPYTYIRHGSGYMIISHGPDRRPHTQDDVILLRRN